MRRLIGSVVPFLLVGLSVACSPATPPPAPKPVPAAVPSHEQALWGDLKPAVSVKELMRDMIDPASDFVFDSVGTIITKKGRIEITPKTDEDWDRIRVGAVTMAEGAYLL